MPSNQKVKVVRICGTLTTTAMIAALPVAIYGCVAYQTILAPAGVIAGVLAIPVAAWLWWEGRLVARNHPESLRQELWRELRGK